MPVIRLMYNCAMNQETKRTDHRPYFPRAKLLLLRSDIVLLMAYFFGQADVL